MAGFGPIADLPIADVPDAAEITAQSARINIPVYDPRYMDLPYWSTLVTTSLLAYGFVGKSANEENWRDWADQVRALPALASLHVPEPRWYATWRDWAFKLNESLWLVNT